MSFQNALSYVLSIVFPPKCICCDIVTSGRKSICGHCQKLLPHVELPVCLHCGSGTARCNCDKKPMAYTRCVSPFYYEGIMRDIIKKFKFGGRKDTAVYLGDAMAEVIKREYNLMGFDLVVAVPLSAERLSERGYNQSALLAKQVAKNLHKEYTSFALKKVCNNRVQHSLKRKEREANVRDVYEAGKYPTAGRNILLIDDIITTGATLHECAFVLKSAGAKQVAAAAACITSIKGL